ncbi:MAG: LOG family protein, partial [Planctomycetota bacterium]
MEIRSLCVFCGSNTGANKVYKAAAQSLGRMLVRRGCRLVYGAGSVGLMGILADTVLQEGGHVTGIIPTALAEKEVLHQGLSETHV